MLKLKISGIYLKANIINKIITYENKLYFNYNYMHIFILHSKKFQKIKIFTK